MPIDRTNSTTACAEDRVAVEDQIPRFGLEGEGFSQLLDDPGGARVEGGIEVEDPSSVVMDDEPAIQDTRREAVGTVKKSMAAMHSLVVAQETQPALNDIGICTGRCGMYRETVVSETVKPSFSSSP